MYWGELQGVQEQDRSKWQSSKKEKKDFRLADSWRACQQICFSSKAHTRTTYN